MSNTAQLIPKCLCLRLGAAELETDTRRHTQVSSPEQSSLDGMKQAHTFRVVLSGLSGDLALQRELFAILNLGIVQSLASGVLSPTEAIERFYHADNCLYVRKQLRNREANSIMSHGVQLPDPFPCLPAEEAQREFLHELETMRTLCLKLLDRERVPTIADQDNIEPPVSILS